jgi:hypothetical protein
VAFVLLVWAATQADAQSAETQAAPKNSLEKGAWALQFALDSDNLLTSYGGSVALKRHVSARTAFRVGFDYGLLTQDQEFEAGATTDTNYQNFGMFVHFLRYTDPEAPVHFFWGTGPFGSYSRSESTQSESYATSESVAETWSVGIDGRIGVEWFATRTLSFHAEYFGTASFQRSERTTTTVDTFKSTQDQWRLTRGPVVFGLSAYF